MDHRAVTSRVLHFVSLLALSAACAPPSRGVSGTWRGSIRDTLACQPCLLLLGLSLRESSDGAITGTVAVDMSFKHDGTSGAAQVHGARRGDTLDVLFAEQGQTRQGIRGVLAPDSSTIRGEVWFTWPDTMAHQYRRPIVLVRAELDSALLALLSEANPR